MSGSYPTKRAKVRDQVAALLAAGVPQVAGRVLRARVWPLQPPELPALLVYGYDETKTLRTVTAADQHWDVALTMAVVARAVGHGKQPEQVEARLEELAGAVCDALLPAAEFTLAADGVEQIGAVRTTMKVEFDGERCVGDVLVALDFQWSEVVTVPPPPVDCEEAALALDVAPSLTGAVP